MSLSIGDEFDTLSDAREAIKQHIIERGESFKVLKGGQSKLHVVVCIEKTCSFRIRASVLRGGIVRITVYQSHICSPIVHQGWKPAHSVSHLVNNHRAAVADNREIKPKQLQSSERLQFGNTISYQQAYRTRETLRAEVEGNEAATFEKFPALFNAIEALDPINGMSLNIDSDDKFQRCFIAPAATRNAAQSCRPLVALDACHTKSQYRMILMMACTLDGNNEILPLAWAVVPTEDGENWSWFMALFHDMFEDFLKQDDIVIISDRDKGLRSSVKEILSNAAHSYCCQHLSANLKDAHGTIAANLFWGIAKAKTREKFETALEKLSEHKNEAKIWVERIAHEEWATYAFPKPRYGQITSNIAESLNSSLERDGSRNLPPLGLMLAIWSRTMTTMYERNRKQHKSSILTDSAKMRFDEQWQQSRRYKVHSASQGLSQVYVPDGVSHVVNIHQRTCTCMEFQQFDSPCRHAIAACIHQGDDPFDQFPSFSWYTLDTYRRTYAHLMHPIREEDLIPIGNLPCGPPVTTKQRGRPRKQRLKRASEGRTARQKTCSSCGRKGHNKKGCRPGIKARNSAVTQ